MHQQRSLQRDLFALALLAFCAFLGISLLTYHRGDLADGAVYPPGGEIANACGRSGAFVSEMLFRGVGGGAYFVWISLVVFDVLLLARRPISEPVLRTVGWIMATWGICTLSSLAFPAWSGPVIGPGGFLGAAGRTILEMNFAAVGSFVVAVSVILAGLLLCTDYVLFRLTAWMVAKPALAAARLGQHTAGRTEGGQKTASLRVRSKGRRNTDDEQPESNEDIEEAARDVSVKVRGKRLPDDSRDEDRVETNDVPSEGEESENDTGEEEVDEGEENGSDAAAKPSIGARLASALRIKNLGKERQQVIDELEAAASRQEEAADYELPPIDLLLANETVFQEEHEKEVREKAKKLEQTFASFGFKVKVVEIETGPVIAQYEVELEAGLRLSKITSLAEDLAIALRVPSVRIVAPIPGKNTVGIEVPNATRQLVRLREVIEETNGKAKKMRIPVYLGKDVAGNPMVVDLTTLPHLLIAGRTGTGKSVCLNSIIVSMLMSRRPDEVKMLLIDPKMVELSPYKRLPHLMHPVVTDMRKAEAILAWAVEKMEERYALLARAGVRHISVYNQLGEEELMDRLQPENDEERDSIPLNLPYIVIVADEMADLMMTSGKEVEQHIIRLAQKSRAVGIHLILATQKPTVDVITGLIKSNLPARIAFQVASRVDSRVVLDEMGADKLLGNGDMLFLWPGTSTLLRGQGTYLSDDEINRVVDFVGTTEPQFAKELVALKPKNDNDGKGINLKNRDDLYESAVDIVIREGRGSVSLLQRTLGIGYGRAARLIDYMAEDGIVGEYNGSQARDVLITLEQWAEMQGEKPDPAAAAKPKKNRILPAPASAEDDDRLDEEGEGDGGHDDDFDDDPPFDGPDDDESNDDGDDHDTPPPRHVPLRSLRAGARACATAGAVEDTGDEESAAEYDEDDTSFEVDGDRSDDSQPDDGDTAADDQADEGLNGEPVDDEKYAHINPALLARLRIKRLRDRQQRLRRSA